MTNFREGNKHRKSHRLDSKLKSEINRRDSLAKALEEKIAFLQNMIDDLNMVVFRQGEKIEQLNSKLKETNEKLSNHSDSTSNISQINDDKPPHY